MKVRINFGGIVVAIFFGFLAAAVFHLSTAWCVVIGIGAVPAVLVVLRILIGILELPAIDRLDRSLSRRSNARKRRRNEKRIAANKERMRKNRDTR